MTRELDVIDVNLSWAVYLGRRRGSAYRVGTVHHANSFLARQEARAKYLGTRPGFVERDDL